VCNGRVTGNRSACVVRVLITRQSELRASIDCWIGREPARIARSKNSAFGATSWVRCSCRFKSASDCARMRTAPHAPAMRRSVSVRSALMVPSPSLARARGDGNPRPIPSGSELASSRGELAPSLLLSGVVAPRFCMSMMWAQVRPGDSGESGREPLGRCATLPPGDSGEWRRRRLLCATSMVRDFARCGSEVRGAAKKVTPSQLTAFARQALPCSPQRARRRRAACVRVARVFWRKGGACKGASTPTSYRRISTCRAPYARAASAPML